MGTEDGGNGPTRSSAGMGGDGYVSALPLSYRKVALPGGIRTRDLSLPMRSSRSLHLARMGIVPFSCLVPGNERKRCCFLKRSNRALHLGQEGR